MAYDAKPVPTSEARRVRCGDFRSATLVRRAAIDTFPGRRATFGELDHAGECQMARKGLDGRHRDTTGRIDRKHGNTRVGSLRKTYGEHFAKGRRKDMMLKTLLAETGTDSLRAYLHKHHK
jgi:hypothetical protein